MLVGILLTKKLTRWLRPTGRLKWTWHWTNQVPWRTGHIFHVTLFELFYKPNKSISCFKQIDSCSLHIIEFDVVLVLKEPLNTLEQRVEETD